MIGEADVLDRAARGELDLSATQAAMGDLEVRLASDMILDPEVMTPPRVVIPRTAFRGRLTLLAAPKKAGKSTYLTTALAAVTTNRLLFGEMAEPCTTLWACLDEPQDDFLRRLKATGADLALVFVATPPATSAQLIAAALLHNVDLLVVDSVTDLSAGEITSENDNAEVKRFLAPFRLLARDHGVAVVFLHHTAKASGQSRGAGAFEDVADHIMTIAEGEDETLRLVRVKGRLAVDDFAFCLTEDGLEMPDREISVMSLVRSFVWSHPGCLSSEVYDGVGKQREKVRQAIAKLANAGTLENRGTGRKKAWHVREAGNEFGKRFGIALEPAQEMAGHGSETNTETPFVSRPSNRGAGETIEDLGGEPWEREREVA